MANGGHPLGIHAVPAPPSPSPSSSFPRHHPQLHLLHQHRLHQQQQQLFLQHTAGPGPGPGVGVGMDQAAVGAATSEGESMEGKSPECDRAESGREERGKAGGAGTGTGTGTGAGKTAAAAVVSGTGGRGKQKESFADWSSGAINSLLDAFTEKNEELNGRNLRGRDWEEVTSAVNARSDACKAAKSVLQCRNKLDNLKKRHKIEKDKMFTTGSLKTKWQWFAKMDAIVGRTAKQARPTPPSSALPMQQARPPPPHSSPPQATSALPAPSSASADPKKKPRKKMKLSTPLLPQPDPDPDPDADGTPSSHLPFHKLSLNAPSFFIHPLASLPGPDGTDGDIRHTHASSHASSPPIPFPPFASLPPFFSLPRLPVDRRGGKEGRREGGKEGRLPTMSDNMLLSVSLLLLLLLLPWICCCQTALASSLPLLCASSSLEEDEMEFLATAARAQPFNDFSTSVPQNVYSKVTEPTLAAAHLRDLPGFTRSVYEREYALIAPESQVYSALPGWINTLAAYLITPAMGSHFSMYLAQMKANSSSAPPLNDVERFIFVVKGEVQLSTSSTEGYNMHVDWFAYLPPNTQHSLKSTFSATIVVFERRYIKDVIETDAPELIVGVTDKQPVLETPGEVFALRKLLPTSSTYDFNIHVMDFQPGEFLNVKEVHYFQHGLLLLEGRGIYRLGEKWHPVQAGDVIWMAPFVPQWYAALGRTRSRYLLYKDVNRDPLLHPY